jgi:hypothetical protein
MARIKLWLAGIGAFVVALLGVYWRGRSDADDAAAERELNEYVETRKRMDAVNISDADAGREFLRNRKSSRDL